jgi:hypothetical protein
MTLCIAWRKEGKVSFASDSRISDDDEDNLRVDIAIKVMEIPVKINYPTPFETQVKKVAYQHTLGLCYSGDVITAHILKETIVGILGNLQFHPEQANFSLQGICNVIGGFLEDTADQMKNSAERDPKVEFLIGGLCPEREQVLVYAFDMFYSDGHYKALIDEVLQEEGDILMLGAQDKAKEIIESKGVVAGVELLSVLREICMDDTEPSVGGFLQYGNFANVDFRIFGVMDYDVDENGYVDYIVPYRGIVLSESKTSIVKDGFHINVPFISPFEKEMDEIRKKGFRK